MSNGHQTYAVAAIAMKGRSVDFSGYWQGYIWDA
jgi:hypothetical protein